MCQVQELAIKTPLESLLQLVTHDCNYTVAPEMTASM